MIYLQGKTKQNRIWGWESEDILCFVLDPNLVGLADNPTYICLK
jgi:hypothetical protein